jgi:hypothetical protein
LVVRRGWLEAVSKRSTDRKCRVPLPSWSHRRLFRQNPRHTRPHTGCHVWPGFRDIRVSHHICGQRVLDRSTGHGLRSSMRRPWRLRYSVPIRDRTAARAIWLSDDSSKHGDRLVRFDCTIPTEFEGPPTGEREQCRRPDRLVIPQDEVVLGLQC